MDVRYRKQRIAIGGGTGADQSADIDGSFCHNPVKGCNDLGETLHCQELVYIGLCRLGGTNLAGQVGVLFVGVLFGYRVKRQKVVPALGRDSRELLGRLGGAQIGAGLGNLLVQFGRVDQSQHIAFFYMGADILVPGMHVTGHTRKKLGVVIGLKCAGQDQRLAFAAGFRAKLA